MNISLSVERIKHWGLKGGMAVLDQGLYSGANFILSLLLARWLLASQYGAYSIAFAVYQFAYQAHNSIIIEPMSVLGPSRMADRLSDILREQIKLHFVISLLAGLITFVIGVLTRLFNQTLGNVMITLGVALPFVLLPLLMRRGFYLFQKPELALFGSLLYVLFLCVLLWTIKTFIGVSVEWAFPIIGLAGLVSGIYLIKQIPVGTSVLQSLSITWSNNWDYGKWLVYSSLWIALAAQVQTFVVGALFGLSDAGAFRALQNFVQPLILFFTALSALLLPSMSYDFGTNNIDALKRKGKLMLILFLCGSIFFEMILFIYSSQLESVVYDGKFSSYTNLIPIWGLVPIAASFTYVYYFLLQSIQQPRAVLIGSIAWSISGVLFSLVFGILWGIAGATLSVIVGYVIAGLMFALFYRHHISRVDRVRSKS